MQKGWGLNISMIYLPINPKTILNFFSRIIEIQNTIQNLENILSKKIFMFSDSLYVAENISILEFIINLLILANF